ncbi:MAG: RsmB/NOP family class I SAM-dependent RNA methyltransferase [Candidatus Heimdallarchaeum endolithica]|uniref:RsmB/NOP family class I SAM-dependent RNA methyltransferase n=1 Tax=Candidatus Heimdallarchaeum endolithica TaxID=2876572 RepID=A0A9Y1FN84_9ARCH|nr:MAG: RsmB/NOP family class I SAM-dependent RNA methyltransferase [Candidatus Heimdallarchaeum endolithica]
MNIITKPVIAALVQVEKGDSIRNAMNRVRTEYTLTKDEEARIYYIVFNIIGKLNVIDLYIKESSSYFSLKKLSFEKKALLRLITFIVKYSQVYSSMLSNIKKEFNAIFKKNEKFVFDEIVRNIESVTMEMLKRNKDEVSLLSLKYSTPTWIIRKLFSQWGENFSLDFLNSIQTVLPTYIRVNTLKSELKEIESVLTSFDIKYQIDKDVPNLIQIKKSPIALPRLDIFKDGKIVIQQKSSALVSLILNPKPQDLILDLCAAPGQKSSHLAALINSGNNIFACELNERRVSILKQRMELLGVKGIEIVNTDSKMISSLFKNKFNKILLDPPCTGSGTYSTRPETKFRLEKRDLKFYTNIQKKLLDESARILEDGGEITYSTCSIFKDENVYVIEEFLSKHTNFSISKMEPMIGLRIESLENKAQMLTPSLHNTEGFFIVKLRKD